MATNESTLLLNTDNVMTAEHKEDVRQNLISSGFLLSTEDDVEWSPIPWRNLPHYCMKKKITIPILKLTNCKDATDTIEFEDLKLQYLSFYGITSRKYDCKALDYPSHPKTGKKIKRIVFKRSTKDEYKVLIGNKRYYADESLYKEI